MSLYWNCIISSSTWLQRYAPQTILSISSWWIFFKFSCGWEIFSWLCNRNRQVKLEFLADVCFPADFYTEYNDFSKPLSRDKEPSGFLPRSWACQGIEPDLQSFIFKYTYCYFGHFIISFSGKLESVFPLCFLHCYSKCSLYCSRNWMPSVDAVCACVCVRMWWLW